MPVGFSIVPQIVIAHYIEKPLMGILVVLLVFNLTQRRHLEHGERKRFATLGLSGLVLLLYVAALAIKRYPLEDYVLVFGRVNVV